MILLVLALASRSIELEKLVEYGLRMWFIECTRLCLDRILTRRVRDSLGQMGPFFLWFLVRVESNSWSLEVNFQCK